MPFRKLVSRFGAGLVVSEMIASEDMLNDRPSTRAKAALGSDLGLKTGTGAFGGTSVQIAGREAAPMAACARLCAEMGARIIDINMGCPAKKVTSGYSGSALMREPNHALSLIEAVVAAVDVPVTLKMRLGWDDDQLNAAQIARRAADAGVRMITVHGRTRCQFYKGEADWAGIAPVVEAVDVPVIANGDIIDARSARAARHASGAAGVMVGRGAQGQPWMLAQIAAALFGTNPPEIPTGTALADMIAAHYEDMLSFYGLPLGLRCARKHLGWYMDRLGTPKPVRREILTQNDPAQVLARLADLPMIPAVTSTGPASAAKERAA